MEIFKLFAQAGLESASSHFWAPVPDITIFFVWTISSQVVRIIGVSHQCLAWKAVLKSDVTN
jgi:hypothetical protein